LSATPLLAFLGSAPAKTGLWRSLAWTGVLWAEAPHGWQPRWMDAASSSSLAKHSELEKGHNLMLWCRTQGLWGSKTLKILELSLMSLALFWYPFHFVALFFFFSFFLVVICRIQKQIIKQQKGDKLLKEKMPIVTFQTWKCNWLYRKGFYWTVGGDL
jgi:hypothetical protein